MSISKERVAEIEKNCREILEKIYQILPPSTDIASQEELEELGKTQEAISLFFVSKMASLLLDHQTLIKVKEMSAEDLANVIMKTVREYSSIIAEKKNSTIH